MKRDYQTRPNPPSHKTRPPRGCTQNPNPKLPSAEMGQKPGTELGGGGTLSQIVFGDKNTIIPAIVDERVWYKV